MDPGGSVTTANTGVIEIQPGPETVRKKPVIAITMTGFFFGQRIQIVLNISSTSAASTSRI